MIDEQLKHNLKQNAQKLSRRATGLYGKFRIIRTDGSSAEGKKHHGCEYFVLDLTHDPFALPALKAYADACANKYPALALDLYEQIEERK